MSDNRHTFTLHRQSVDEPQATTLQKESHYLDNSTINNKSTVLDFPNERSVV